MTVKRRSILSMAAATGAASWLSPAAAQTFPNKPIRLIVPFAAGGNIDVAARALAPPLEEQLKQSVIVDNRPGAGGALGMQMTARAAADGYTIVIGAPSMVATLPLIQPTGYAFRDVEPVSLVSKTSLVVVVRANDPRFQTVADLAAWARRQPGAISAAHPSPGSPNHMALLQLEAALDIGFNVIPYKGSAPALIDLIGGQLDVYFDQISSSLPYIKAGRLRALVVCGLTPDPALPDTKTVGQLGLKAFDATTYAGIFVPARTPASVIERLSTAIEHATRDARMALVLGGVGSTPSSSTREEFVRLLDTESRLAQQFIREDKLKPDA